MAWFDGRSERLNTLLNEAKQLEDDAFGIPKAGLGSQGPGPAFPEAIARYTLAIELEPSCSHLWAARARAFLRAGRLNEARSDAARAFQLGDPDPDDYRVLADAFEESDWVDVMRAGVEAASRAGTETHHLRLKMTNYFMARQSWTAAIDQLQQTLSNTAESNRDVIELCWVLLGRCRHALGDHEGSADAYSRLLFSGKEGARTNSARRMVETLLDAGQWQRARNTLLDSRVEFQPGVREALSVVMEFLSAKDAEPKPNGGGLASHGPQGLARAIIHAQRGKWTEVAKILGEEPKLFDEPFSWRRRCVEMIRRAAPN